MHKSYLQDYDLSWRYLFQNQQCIDSYYSYESGGITQKEDIKLKLT